jgi:hypothetical protein
MPKTKPVAPAPGATFSHCHFKATNRVTAETCAAVIALAEAAKANAIAIDRAAAALAPGDGPTAGLIIHSGGDK